MALNVCECKFLVRCGDDESSRAIRSVFSSFIEPAADAATVLRRYDVQRRASGGFDVSDGGESVHVEDVDNLLFCLDKDITLLLQRTRRDWFFLHAAVVAWGGRAAVLAAFSGTGKSTLTLAALTSGLEYLSDELAPIDLTRMVVQPFPHALCLKSPPPAPYSLPAGTVLHGQRFHVPVEALPSVTRREPLPLAALIFIQRDGRPFDGIRAITSGSAVARLMAHALNSLAHPGYGLDAAVVLSQSVPCFELEVTDLRAATDSIKSVLSSDPSQTNQPGAARDV